MLSSSHLIASPLLFHASKITTVDEEPEKEGDAGAAEEAAEAFSSLKVGKEGEKAKASSPVKPAAEK